MTTQLKSIEIATIYKIAGGFQKAQQNVQNGLPVEIETVKNSDYPVQAKCHAQYSYTNTAWAVDLDALKKECTEWCNSYGKVTFNVH